MNTYLNALMSIQLPFAVIPTLTFTASPLIMGDFASSLPMKLFTTTVSFIIIGINIFFVIGFVQEDLPQVNDIFISILFP